MFWFVNISADHGQLKYTNNHGCVYFSLVYLNFSSSRYEGYEHDGELCVTVTLDKPALFNTAIQILQSHVTATGKWCSHYIHMNIDWYMWLDLRKAAFHAQL